MVVLAYDGLCMFEFAIAVEIFGLPRPEMGRHWYRFDVCSLESGPLRSTGGIHLKVGSGLSRLSQAGTIVIPGWRAVDVLPPPRLIASLRKAYASGARLVSICSGVFVLAATGLLNKCLCEVAQRASRLPAYSCNIRRRACRVLQSPGSSCPGFARRALMA